MAKFNKGEFGHIQYKIKPTGIRNWFNLYKIIPYILGNDVRVKLTFQRMDIGVWWSQCEFTVITLGQSEIFNIAVGNPNGEGKWSRLIRLAHPLEPCIISCKLALRKPTTLGKLDLKPVSIRGRVIIEDLRVLSSHTVMAWVFGIFLGIAVLIVGIWNLVLLTN